LDIYDKIILILIESNEVGSKKEILSFLNKGIMSIIG
jgi:hypothetical protein